jgi:hypothetical protein
MAEHLTDETDDVAPGAGGPKSAVTPRPRAGFTSGDDEVPTETYVSFVAAALRAGIGAAFVFMAMLWLPVHMMTPILTGMGVLMVANGLLSTWRLGRTTARLQVVARVFVYGIPSLVVLMFVALAVLGPSSLGPDWSALRAERARAEEPPQ